MQSILSKKQIFESGKTKIRYCFFPDGKPNMADGCVVICQKFFADTHLCLNGKQCPSTQCVVGWKDEAFVENHNQNDQVWLVQKYWLALHNSTRAKRDFLFPPTLLLPVRTAI